MKKIHKSSIYIYKIGNVIKKHELKKNYYYTGTCRNTHIAQWNGKDFIFINYCFDQPYIETINYFGDVINDSIDGFIPMTEISWNYDEIKNAKLEQDYNNSARKIYHNLSEIDMKNEIWKPIPKFSNLYQISNYGRVKVIKSNKILKQNFSREYLIVGLNDNNKIRKTVRVHRLVALTFKSLNNTLLKSHEVNHINGIKSDNREVNLEWTTHKSNCEKSFISGNYSVKLTPEIVIKIKEQLRLGNMKQIDVAKMFNISTTTISEIKTGKKWVQIKL